MKNHTRWGAVALVVACLVLVLAGCRATDGPWGQTMAAWIQAVGSVLAILAAIAVANRQMEQARLDASRAKADLALAAVSLASKSLEQVADRLTAAARVGAGKSLGLALREHRTTELVETLRQVSIGDLPPSLVLTFSTLRSRLYAVNARITEIYNSEQKDPSKEARRSQRIRSSLATYEAALADYRELADQLRALGAGIPPDFEEPTILRAVIRQESLESSGDEE